MVPAPLKTDETWTLACRLAGMADERVRTIRIDEKLREARHAGIRQGREEIAQMCEEWGGRYVDVAMAIRAQLNRAPGHTDLMVSPESIDAFLDANPPSDPTPAASAAMTAERHAGIRQGREDAARRVEQLCDVAGETEPYETIARIIRRALPDPAPAASGEEVRR